MLVNYLFMALGFLQPPGNTLRPESFGARADAVVADGGSVEAGSTTLSLPSAAFGASDLGKTIYIPGAGKNKGTLVDTIDAVLSAGQARLRTAAVSGVQNQTITYGTESTAAFVALNRAARQAGSAPVTVVFTKGIYLTRFNNWLAGIRQVTVEGNGASILNVNGAYAPAANPNANIGLFMPSCFDNVDNGFYGSQSAGNIGFGSLVKSADKGATSLRTKNPADAGNFAPGTWVLLFGYDHEGINGYPPDAKYFDYAKVHSVNTTDGTIVLDRPIRYAYDENWVDGKGKDAVSAPRLVSLDRGNFTTIERLVIRNLHFPAFAGWTGPMATRVRNGRMSIFGYIEANLVGVTAQGSYAGQGKSLTYDSCTLLYECEADKEVDAFTIRHSSVYNLASAGGVNVLTLSGNQFTGPFSIAPHYLVMEENNFSTTAPNSSAAMASIGFNKGIDSARIGTNYWVCSDPHRQALFSASGKATLKVASVARENTILVSQDDWFKGLLLRAVQPGAEGITASGKKFTVTTIEKYDDNNLAITGQFSSPPVAGDAFIFSYAPHITLSGTQVKKGSFTNASKVFQ